MQPVTTVRFDLKIREQLDKMAEQMDRPRAWIIKEAVAQYLERETWYLAEVQKGIDDMEAGRVISHDEMATRLKAKGFNVAS
ncbi:MAG: CopG family ribbon-helix-helix protein [Desulfovibrio sp.]|jgi:predicted transcriptional regulator|nr:CopG family ribbon-helix-helix protein [Desulfovibrio sp.]